MIGTTKLFSVQIVVKASRVYFNSLLEKGVSHLEYSYDKHYILQYCISCDAYNVPSVIRMGSYLTMVLSG
jgi:ribosomal protein S26